MGWLMKMRSHSEARTQHGLRGKQHMATTPDRIGSCRCLLPVHCHAQRMRGLGTSLTTHSGPRTLDTPLLPIPNTFDIRGWRQVLAGSTSVPVL